MNPKIAYYGVSTLLYALFAIGALIWGYRGLRKSGLRPIAAAAVMAGALALMILWQWLR